jgi:small-conductance mechanosensitive channel
MNLQAFLEYVLLEVGSYRLTVGMLIGIAVTLLMAWLAIRLVGRGLMHRRAQRRLDAGRRHSLFLIVQYLVWIVAVAASLEIVGIRLSVLIAGSAALLVGLGLGMQQIFRDIVSGIFLLFEGTVEVGDLLQLDGQVVRVEQINLRTSKLSTRDGRTLIVPNSRFITESVTNWSYSNRASAPGRFAIRVAVAYDADERLVREALLACAEAHPDIVHGDAAYTPNAQLAELTDTRQLFDLQFWTQRKFEVDAIRSDLRYAVRQALRERQVPVMPVPDPVFVKMIEEGGP